VEVHACSECLLETSPQWRISICRSQGEWNVWRRQSAAGVQKHHQGCKRGAKILGSEKVHASDTDADCWVVSLEYGPLGSEASAPTQAAGFAFSDFVHTETLWVDKNCYLVYREDSTTKMTMPNTNTPINMTQTSRVETFTVNEPVSPDVFTFTPPPGAREIDESKFLRKTAEVPQKKN